MTELHEKTIAAIHLITEAIKKTEFELNSFEVDDTNYGQRIEMRISEKNQPKGKEAKA